MTTPQGYGRSILITMILVLVSLLASLGFEAVAAESCGCSTYSDNFDSFVECFTKGLFCQFVLPVSQYYLKLPFLEFLLDIW